MRQLLIQLLEWYIKHNKTDIEGNKMNKNSANHLKWYFRVIVKWGAVLDSCFPSSEKEHIVA
jgi:hypothetical protein